MAFDPSPAETRRRGFRFGVSVRSAASRADWVDKARRAETLGYDTSLVADHLAAIDGAGGSGGHHYRCVPINPATGTTRRAA